MFQISHESSISSKHGLSTDKQTVRMQDQEENKGDRETLLCFVDFSPIFLLTYFYLKGCSGIPEFMR